MSDMAERLNAALEGRYAIERELGEGGMATVYLADDLKHNRNVALKVLKPELAAVVGAERFLAEIQVTANLQHPHILPLFDSGEADGFLFYVMPYVEGETLRDRIDREKQLPVDEAVALASKVAGALQHAHEHGVIHRDIKPGNILLQGGEPVVSDFGIALAVGAAGSNRLTETGLSLGTPYYMSPEQATGDQAVGASTDTYALGSVLYEMLVGDPPFAGSTAQAVLGKIIAGKSVSAMEERPSIPANVDAAVRKALEKLPADRFTSAQDFVRALGDEHFRYGELATVGEGVGVGLWNWLTITMTTLATVTTLTLGWSLLRSEPHPLARFEVTLGEDRALASGASGLHFALSPDGSRIVYVGTAPGGGTQLWQRALDDLEPDPVPGTERALNPMLSPDGQSVAFEAQGGIKTVSLQGGAPNTVVSTGRNPSWGSDQMIYFAQLNENGERIIYRIPAAGGEPEAVTAPSDGNQVFPDVLPGGDGLLLTLRQGPAAVGGQSRIAVASTQGGDVREILTGTRARYAVSGHVVYTTANGTLRAAPFDARRLEVTGPSVTLLEGVRTFGNGAQFAVSATGTLLYGASGAAGTNDLVWVSRTGVVEPVDPGWTGDFVFPDLSPDGRRLAVTITSSDSSHVWVKQLDRGPSLRLTLEGSLNRYPSWTHDGGSLTFYSDRAGGWDLWTKRADGSEPAVLELDRERDIADARWSPDGEWLVYRISTFESGSPDILALRPGQDTVPVTLVATEFTEQAPTLSPDGRWLAYTSNETGTAEVYVVPFPNASDARWPVSTSGGGEPVWSRSGRELFYRNGQGDMVAVEVETEPTFSPERSTVLFSAVEFGRNVNNHPMYDVTPDGRRFIMIRQGGGDVRGSLILVQNFFEELKERVPN